ncbi:orotate phosphoribosyltransferase [Petrotoga olearia]|uniref:Orotate phosphoribosyltransferase n=2 Tax=Petrotoga olearia TaxID=156203 RepID=A0A2K1NWP0_9BACT|nr:orotate phosphoribosyltransferase [Petrotoga olearia]PNR94929.1 orotate phosphoribosyltransferase [Petrotoga olearia DSM 13574]RMA73227.1 orotate phosphoribosyltransferase [Petrotoga olearia]
MDNHSTNDETKVLEILKDTGAFLTGHFLLSSGLHSDTYIQCAKVLKYPDYSELFGKLIAKKVESKIDYVVSPALGGIIIGYEVARTLKVPFLFAERDEKGNMSLRRDQVIKNNSKILIVEDVITTGKSTLEVAKLVESNEGVVTSFACIVNRSSKEVLENREIISLVNIKAATYSPENCPLCFQGLELVKPGSRKQ